MVYIRKVNDQKVELGGQVATDHMLQNGWFEYDGPVPAGEHHRLDENGVLVAFTPEPTVEQLLIQYKKYLQDTDYKMLPNYVPKDGENLEIIITKRNIARNYIRTNTII